MGEKKTLLEVYIEKIAFATQTLKLVFVLKLATNLFNGILPQPKC